MARRGRRETHTTAFVMGAMLVGAAAAAYTLWHAPAAGATTRRRLLDRVEGAVFSALGAGEATTARLLSPEQPVPLPAAAPAGGHDESTTGA